MTQPFPTPLPSPRLPKQTLITLIQTIAQVQVQWARDPNDLVGAGQNLEEAWVVLSIGPYRSIGTDELRGTCDATNDQNAWLQLGDRQFTLKCKCCSLDANLEGADLAERIRFRIRSATARAIFVPAKLALVTIMPAVPVPFWAGNQMVDAWQLDIKMGWRASADPLDPGEGDYIQTVNGTNNVPITGE